MAEKPRGICEECRYHRPSKSHGWQWDECLHPSARSYRRATTYCGEQRHLEVRCGRLANWFVPIRREKMDHREVHGVRRAITWLHERAKEMNDMHARAILDSAAFSLGVDLKKWRGETGAESVDDDLERALKDNERLIHNIAMRGKAI